MLLTIPNIETLCQPCSKVKDDDQTNCCSHDENRRLGTFIPGAIGVDDNSPVYDSVNETRSIKRSQWPCRNNSYKQRVYITLTIVM